MFTLCIRYTLNPNRLADFRHLHRRRDGSHSPKWWKDCWIFPANPICRTYHEAFGLIEFATLAEYERYRGKLAADAAHKENYQGWKRAALCWR